MPLHRHVCEALGGRIHLLELLNLGTETDSRPICLSAPSAGPLSEGSLLSGSSYFYHLYPAVCFQFKTLNISHLKKYKLTFTKSKYELHKILQKKEKKSLCKKHS